MTIPHFLNVDLDVAAKGNLQPLMDHWQAAMITVVTPEIANANFVRFELALQPEYATGAIQQFCELVENLPPDLYAFWHTCPDRALDIGIQSGTENPALTGNLPAALLGRVALHFTSLGWTVYGGGVD